MDAEKKIDKNQHSFMTKSLRTKNRSLPHPIKVIKKIYS